MNSVVALVYLGSASLFILGLKRLSSPDTARTGNLMAAIAMLLAVAATLVNQQIVGYTWIVVGMVAGSLIGVVMARTVEMTAMPQMVAVFNGFGGGASGLVAIAEYLSWTQGGALNPGGEVSMMAGTVIGAVTFSGSMVAFGKLEGIVTERVVTYPLQKTGNTVLFLGILAAAVLAALSPALNVFLAMAAGTLLLGVLIVLPIGGADMPVVVSLLNSYSGLAAAAAGFVLNNYALITAGSLVGAAGFILTVIMCKAMNRSLTNVMFGAFGTGAAESAAETGERTANQVDAEEAAMLLGYASKVVIVPGYGLAVAQAQQKLKELADQLTERGVEVKYAIHPVAGRMPGHMNVLLAEADVPYTQLYEAEEVNPEMPTVDVALVVGANDVTNPAARDDPESPIAGMPIVEVDRAQNVIILKRSLSPGFAGVDNELFFMDDSYMHFGDAAETIPEILSAVKDL
ncbi:MAG: NAD(P)(+) transhydrogenase (Re/Si-specific) subunit beta [Candidatus Palauibacterales bacterium]|nr:NAD(P)(+) transhydrogenase (Re/Si-specific) subunit beta [Candidatus Palauibacterales bacterium]